VVLVEKTVEILRKCPLCDSCLGRQFALLGKGVTNSARGRALKLIAVMELHQRYLSGDEQARKCLEELAGNGVVFAATILGKEVTERECFICRGLMSRLDELARQALPELEQYEYSTFLVGVKMHGDYVEREDKLRAEFQLEYGESIKGEFTREVGKRLAALTGKKADLEKPDMIIIFNLVENRVEITPMPLFIAGRYRKLVRGIPQARWICTECGGRGCERCNWSGKMYPTSVEELIAEPILRAAKGLEAKFHGAGREDVDVRVLGNGRPFVVEVKYPRIRQLDLEELAKTINQHAKGLVEVTELKYGDRKLVRRLKLMSERSPKKYRAVIEVEKPISHEDLRKLGEYFKDRLIEQYTPRRVLHRRADKLRKKKVYEVEAKPIGERMFEALIKCQGGLYVKELISGDEGRTTPSFSEVLGRSARCVELDVVEVGGEV